MDGPWDGVDEGMSEALAVGFEDGKAEGDSDGWFDGVDDGTSDIVTVGVDEGGWDG